jgi:glutamine amidotransferase-like uncharacterized protein
MKTTAAIFMHQPMCSIQGGNAIMSALESKYRFKIFTKHSLEEDFFDNVELVIFPGGFGNSDSFDYLLRLNGDRIKQFVTDGGKYLGICMGAYWAGTYYFNMLDSCDAVQYYKRPTADTRRPHTKNISIVWNGQPNKMFFNDGCALIGDTTKFETIATYVNGDPMAIIQNNLGLIGCHPESELYWYDAYKQMRGQYHNGSHHKLLLEFTNNLMER